MARVVGGSARTNNSGTANGLGRRRAGQGAVEGARLHAHAAALDLRGQPHARGVAGVVGGRWSRVSSSRAEEMLRQEQRWRPVAAEEEPGARLVVPVATKRQTWELATAVGPVE